MCPDESEDVPGPSHINTPVKKPAKRNLFLEKLEGRLETASTSTGASTLLETLLNNCKR